MSNVEVAQQASRIKPPPISISTHTPLCCFPAACCLPPYQQQPVSRVHALGEKETKENKVERNGKKRALISQSVKGAVRVSDPEL